MKRQKLRKSLLLFSMLLFPITINYLSPYLIIRGGFEGIITGSFLFFVGLFLFSLIFGRAYCGWLCPAGALQDCGAAIVDKPTGKKQNRVKFFIWFPWLSAIIAGFVFAGGIHEVNPIYFTDNGISVSEPAGYIIYFFVVFLVLGVSLLFGRRSFCHSACWMAPFMIIGSRIKNRLGYPSLRLKAEKDKCISCKICDKNCPMSLPVCDMIHSNKGNSDECILCGKCADSCPKNVLFLGFVASQKDNKNINLHK